MVRTQVTECRDLTRRGRRWIVQQSYSLPLEFKQIFESFPRPTMPGVTTSVSRLTVHTIQVA